MAAISGYNSSSISALFAGLNSGSSSSSFGIGSIDLSTYNSIRTGTYSSFLNHTMQRILLKILLRQIAAVQQRYHHRKLTQLKQRMQLRRLLMMHRI